MAIPPRPARTTPRVPPRRTASVRHATRRRGWSSTSSLVLFLVVGVLGLVGYYIYDKTFGVLDDVRTVDVIPTKVGATPLPSLLTAPFNVLLVGVDLRKSRLEDGARSDTLIVVRVDPTAKTATMLSIPRDTASDLTLPDGQVVSSGKINAAYQYGYTHPDIYAGNTDPLVSGVNLARQNVERFLGIDIPYWAQVDFQGFQQLVDRLGGITVDVPHAILDAEYPTDDDGYMRLYIPPGLQRMDGVTALRYARTRHADNDFGRGKRQQQVLQAIMAELKQRGLLGKLDAIPALGQTMRESVRTNLPINELATLKGLATLGQDLSPDHIRSLVLEPGNGDDPHIVGGYGSDIHWEPAYVARIVTQFLQGSDTGPVAPETATIQVQNGKGIKNLARSVTLQLNLAKFTTSDPADAPAGEHPHTLILDYSGKPITTRRLAALFRIQPQYIKDMTANKGDAPFGVDIVLLVGDDYQEPLTTQGGRKPQVQVTPTKTVKVKTR